MLSSGSCSSKLTENDKNAVSRYTLPNSFPASNVYLRIKPNVGESDEKIYTIVDSTTLLVRKVENVDKKFTFTRIFDSELSQADFFYHGLRQQVINFLLGESTTILTYGAFNSGKTYTLHGTPESPGVIPRAMEFVFSSVNCTLAPWYRIADDNQIVALDEYERALEIQNKESIINPQVIAEEEYTRARLSLSNSNPEVSEVKERELCSDECMSSVWISAAEIYNDYVYDLLAVNSQERRSLKLATRKDGSTYVNGLKYIPITTAYEACQLLVLVQSRMTVASTAVNVANSRSHTFVTMKLLKYEKENMPDEVEVSTLTFCDVAGCRRFKKKESEAGVTLTESRNINNSLLVLGRCLKAIRDSCSIGDANVSGPFRESKLTRILQKALTGRERVNFVITVDTESESFPETLSVLNFSALARKLSNEFRTSRRNAYSMSTPRSVMSSTLASIAQTPEKLSSIDFEQLEALKRENKVLVEKLEAVANCKQQKALAKVSKETQSEKSFLDYQDLEERNANLTKHLEALECESLNRELEIRQEMADRYSAAIGELEASWKRRAQDVEDEGRDLLKWSVNQVEAFYRERIDNILYNKKRKRNDDNGGIRTICQELENENAMITSKIVVLRDMICSLRTENEFLSTERNKSNFELVLVKEKLKSFHDLIRVYFPELYLKMQDNTNDSSWLVHELKHIFDEKTMNIEMLRRDLAQVKSDYARVESKSTEVEKELHDTKIMLEEVSVKAQEFENEARKKTNLIHNLELQLQLLRKDSNSGQELEIGYDNLKYSPKEKYRSIYGDNFFCKDNIDDMELVTQARVHAKADRYFNFGQNDSLKKVSLSSVDTDMDRNIIGSGDNNIKEDSGIDFSCKSRRSTSINDSSILQETAEKCTQTLSLPEESNDLCLEMEQLMMTDYVNSEWHAAQGAEVLFDKKSFHRADDVKSVISSLRQIADFNQFEVAQCRGKLLTCEAKMVELQEENKKLTQMIEVSSQEYDQRIGSLTRELLTKGEIANVSYKELTFIANQMAGIKDLISSSLARPLFELRNFLEQNVQALKVKDACAETTEAQSDPFKMEEIREEISGLETVLEKCRGEKNNCRERLQDNLEMQSMSETKLETEIDKVALADNPTYVRVKYLSEDIAQSNESVCCAKENLSHFERVRKHLEETSKSETLDSRLSLTAAAKSSTLSKEGTEEKGEVTKLKSQLFESEQEMDSIRKRRNDMIKKYDCMVQHLQIEVEKKKEQLVKLQKLLLSNFTWRYRKLSKKCEKPKAYQLKNLTMHPDFDWKLPRVDKNVDNGESSPRIPECSVVNPRYAHSLNLDCSMKDREIEEYEDTSSACKTEASCPTENSSRLNDLNVDVRQIQSDASDCSEVRCGCGIGFKNAGRQGRMSGWLKVRRSNANTDFLRQPNEEHADIRNCAFEQTCQSISPN